MQTGWAVGCRAIVLLCIVTTALFALADARAFSAGPAVMRAALADGAVSAGTSRDSPPASVLNRACADIDNPFEEGALPGSEGAGPVRLATPSHAAVRLELDPREADAPVPQRPPRA